MTTRRNNIDKSMTEQEQLQQEQNNNGQGYAHHEYYNNNTHTQPGVLPPREAMERIAEAYRANISRDITLAAAHIIEEALKHNMEPETVILAIEETGLASRPSPYYLRAVLRNWAENGVTVSRVRDTIGKTNARPWWR